MSKDTRASARSRRLVHSPRASAADASPAEHVAHIGRQAGGGVLTTRWTHALAQGILDSSPDSILAMNSKGIVVEYNAAAERTFGYRREEALGKELASLIIPPSLRDQHRAGLANYLTSGEGAFTGQRVDTIAMRSDGSEFAVELTISPVETDESPLFVAYLRDITGHTRGDAERDRLRLREQTAPAEAERQAAQFRAVFEAMTDGLVVYDLDGQAVDMNSAMLAMLGAGNYLDTFSAMPPHHPLRQLEIRDTRGQPIPEGQLPQQRLLGGEMLRPEQASEIMVRALDGVDRRFIVTGVPLHGADGVLTGAVCLYRDVAARRIIERQTSSALDTIMRCANIVASYSAPETESHLLGQLAETLLELEAADFTHATLVDEHNHLKPVGIYGVSEEEARVWREGVNQFDPSNLPQLTEVTALLASGRPLLQQFGTDQPLVSTNTVRSLNVHAAITAPVVVNGRLVGIITISRTRPLERGATTPFAPWDIELIADVGRLAGQALMQGQLRKQLTLAEAAQLAAEAAARQRDEFLSIASHELKTPVTSLKLNLQLAQRRLAASHRASGSSSLETLLGTLLPRTTDQVDRLSRLIDDLLDVSRIATDKLALRLETTDLVRVVEGVVEEQRQHNPSRTILLDRPEQPLVLAADADRIGQVVTNYLTNALKYSPDDAPVELTVASAGQSARVAVRDYGAGLPDEERDHIWERFYRAPEVHVLSGSGIGLGLGLYISKSIVERHGGAVGVESGHGQGSRFWFTLPLRPISAAASAEQNPMDGPHMTG